MLPTENLFFALFFLLLASTARKQNTDNDYLSRLRVWSRVPILPVGFYIPPENTRTFYGRIRNRKATARWQCRGKSFVQIGKPIRLKSKFGGDANYSSLSRLTQELMKKIGELVQQATEAAESSMGYPGQNFDLEAR